MQAYLSPGYCIDADHPEVVAYAHAYAGDVKSAREKMINLYYTIRDGFRYDPYGIHPRKEKFKASVVLTRTWEEGAHCIDKAVLLAACARVLGIPSRLHFANVRNHIGTEKLEKELGTDLMVFHGYVEVYIEGKWVSATPAFNRKLCDKLNVSPLEFDGKNDSVFQEYDKSGEKFMVYEHDYGVFDDIPFELMIEEWKKHYPEMVGRMYKKFGMPSK